MDVGRLEAAGTFGLAVTGDETLYVVDSETFPRGRRPRTVAGQLQEDPPMQFSFVSPAQFVESPGKVIVYVGIITMIGERALEGSDC